MFAYDAQIAAATANQPQTMADVLQIMQSVDSLCIAGDGLKWFNWLYWRVTQAVCDRVAAKGFTDPEWMARLDVEFAKLYFEALHGKLTGGGCPECWDVMFSVRDQRETARIQFALAGMNAHINHDLPFAIVSTCRATGAGPQHGTPHYADYTALNATLDSLIDMAKQTLHVRLLGDALPPVSHLEDLLAAWNVATFRENAWDHAEALWQNSVSAEVFRNTVDGITAFAGKALLIPVP